MIHLKKTTGLAIFITAVVVSAALIEVFLDNIGAEKHKHFIGNAGTLMVVMSFVYSMRKKRLLFAKGNMQAWLKLHEIFAVAGTVLILIHAGLHTHAAIPLITMTLMFIAFASGLVGRYVYEGGRAELKIMKDELQAKGLSDAEIEERLTPFIDANKRFLKWRAFHMPLVYALIMFTLFHIVSALYYGGF